MKRAILVSLSLLLSVSGTQFADAAKNRFKRSRLTNDKSEILADKRVVHVTTGEDKIIDLDFEPDPDDKRGFTIGNPTIVAYTLVTLGEKKQIVLKPLKAGVTNITIRDSEGTVRLLLDVRIGANSLLRVASELRDLLRDIEGIDVRIVGKKVVVDGEVLVPSDYGRLSAIISDDSYDGIVLNLVTLSTVSLQYLAKRIQSDISQFAKEVRVRVVNGMIFLEGTVENLDHSKRAVIIAELYLPERRPATQLERDKFSQGLAQPRKMVHNLLVYQPPPPSRKQEKLVRVTVNFVELAKDYNRIFGFKWQPGFTADPTVTIGSNGTDSGSRGISFTATISSLIPKLESAQKAGYARILKTSTLMVRNAQPATLDEQTDIPYIVLGPNGQVGSQSQPVGLTFSVTPTILGQTDDIELELDLKQTSLVGRELGPRGAPTTSRHNVRTSLFVKNQESAAVAGVIGNDVRTQFNKDDPNAGTFSGTTQPLFTLLKSKSHNKIKNQFAIFVTPEIVDNASDGSEDLKKNFRIKSD